MIDCLKYAQSYEQIQQLEDYVLHESGDAPFIDDSKVNYIQTQEDLKQKVNFLGLGVIESSLAYFETGAPGINYQQALRDSNICQTMLRLEPILEPSYTSHFEYWKILIDVELFV
tara:strand:+ start:609 stop:953 length:345 start_codon:yes stop_codon:yes gene_type:complete